MNLEHHLRAQILDGRLSPGARLPSERSLAQEHGVNRVTVRTALERLKASGLLTAHVGRGTVVCDVQTQGGPDLLPDLLRDAEASGGLADVVEEAFPSVMVTEREDATPREGAFEVTHEDGTALFSKLQAGRPPRLSCVPNEI